MITSLVHQLTSALEVWVVREDKAEITADAAGRARVVGGFSRFSRIAYAALAWLFVACVVCQVFLAGMAIFVDPLNWVRHVGFVHLFGELPLVMLLLAFAGRMPKKQGYYLGPVVLFMLVAVAYATVDAGGSVGRVTSRKRPAPLGILFKLAQKVGRFTISALEAGS